MSDNANPYYPIGAEYRVPDDDKVATVLEHAHLAVKLNYLGWVGIKELEYWIRTGRFIPFNRPAKSGWNLKQSLMRTALKAQHDMISRQYKRAYCQTKKKEAG